MIASWLVLAFVAGSLFQAKPWPPMPSGELFRLLNLERDVAIALLLIDRSAP